LLRPIDAADLRLLVRTILMMNDDDEDDDFLWLESCKKDGHK
jgi:hypothetical protein